MPSHHVIDAMGSRIAQSNIWFVDRMKNENSERDNAARPQRGKRESSLGGLRNRPLRETLLTKTDRPQDIGRAHD